MFEVSRLILIVFNSILCTSTKAYNMDHPQEYSSCDLGVHWWKELPDQMDPLTDEMGFLGTGFQTGRFVGKRWRKTTVSPDTEDDCEVIYPISFYDIIYIYIHDVILVILRDLISKSSFHGWFGVVDMKISATRRDKSLRIRTWVADCQFQSVISSPSF